MRQKFTGSKNFNLFLLIFSCPFYYNFLIILSFNFIYFFYLIFFLLYIDLYLFDCVLMLIFITYSMLLLILSTWDWINPNFVWYLCCNKCDTFSILYILAAVERLIFLSFVSKYHWGSNWRSDQWNCCNFWLSKSETSSLHWRSCHVAYFSKSFILTKSSIKEKPRIECLVHILWCDDNTSINYVI